MSRRLLILPLLILGIAIGGACGGDEDEPAASTAVTTTSAAVTSSPAAAAYPVTVKDGLGRDVRVGAQPARIVTTSPSAAELLYAVGGTAVARSTTARFPAQVAALTDIGPSYEPSFEKILAQRPDLVLADSSAQAHLRGAFEGALREVPIAFVGAQKYDDVAVSLRLVGKLVNRPEQAEAAAKAMDDAKARSRSMAMGKPQPKTLIINGAVNDFFVALPDSFVGDLAKLAGADNVAANERQAGRFPGYTQLSLERIVAANPEVIITITAGPPGGPTLADQFKSNPAYAGLAAVKNGRVHNVDVEVYLQAPGPRAADGLLQLTSLLHPAR